MKILAIETSCDETAIAIVKYTNDTFEVLGNALFSQASLHAKYGGVYPDLAKREHSKNLPLLLKEVLKESNLLSLSLNTITEKDKKWVEKILEREIDLSHKILEFLNTHAKPEIDGIAVTQGPGLAPCLWTGLNFAKVLAVLWKLPLIPVNHMEGHIASALPSKESFPIMALLISGGHTQLVFVKEWGKYEIVGETQDDAVGEAFDKVARILGLPYPGGPEISKLAEKARKENYESKISLPRPMIRSNDFNFSFSGLKTAVLYLVRDIKEMSDETKACIAREFEDAVTDVLLKKTKDAMEKYLTQTLIIAGGVSANSHIIRSFKKEVSVHTPPFELTGDNAVMIGMAACLNKEKVNPDLELLKAEGNLRL